MLFGGWARRPSSLGSVPQPGRSGITRWPSTISAFPRNPPFSGLGARLHYLPIATREPDGEALRDHIPVLLRNNALEAAAGLDLDVAHSRLMLCGNPSMIQETRELLGEKGFATPRRLQPGTLAIEKYW